MTGVVINLGHIFIPNHTLLIHSDISPGPVFRADVGICTISRVMKWSKDDNNIKGVLEGTSSMSDMSVNQYCA